MAKVKVRVLYPSAFAAIGVDTEGADEATVEKEQADWLIASGYAEESKSSVKKTETADVKLKADR